MENISPIKKDCRQVRRENMLRYHARMGHFRREWATLRLPKDVVEFIQNVASTSPTEYIVSKISRDGYRVNKPTPDPRQMDLFNN